MTTISILTGGSRGDVQPYIALGKGLKEAGYDIRLIASDDFKTLVEEANLTFCSTGVSVEAIIQSDEWRSVNENGNFFTIIRMMQSEMKTRAQKMAQDLPAMLEGSDYLLSGVAGIGGGFSLAEHQHIPIIQAYLFPITPTHEFPSPLTPNLLLGNRLNKISYRAVQQALWQSTRMGDVETRKLLNLSRAPFLPPFNKMAKQGIPTLYGYSRHILPKPDDWSNTHHVTGYWFLDANDSWNPPHDFVDFLNAGDKPIYIGFGSMVNKDPEKVLATISEALSISGQRGVLSSGWGGLAQDNLPDNVYMIKSMPHSWLFPKMATIVHHGGAGTTAAGLRAGVPTIIVPFMGDQPFWGQQIEKLGVGTKPIPRKELAAKKLADAIQQTLNDEAIREKATLIGEKIHHEAGIKNAVSIIHEITNQKAFSKIV